MSSIVCEIDSKSETTNTSKRDHEVQFVPAKIKYSGPEKIDPYFTNFIQKNDNGSFNTALRGRPLTGKP